MSTQVQFIVRCAVTKQLVNIMAPILAMVVKAFFEEVLERIICIRVDLKKIVLLTRIREISADFVDLKSVLELE